MITRCNINLELFLKFKLDNAWTLTYRYKKVCFILDLIFHEVMVMVIHYFTFTFLCRGVGTFDGIDWVGQGSPGFEPGLSLSR